MALDEPVLAAHAIQGNVLPGFNTRHMHLLGLTIPPGGEAGARAFLGTTHADVAASDVDALARAREARREAAPAPRTWVNVVLSYRGLRALAGASAATVADPWFRNGMWSVAGGLGEAPGSVAGWTVGGSEDATPDILVLLGDDDPVRLAGTLDDLRDRATAQGLRHDVLDEAGERLDGGVEHFGFRDGVSRPAVRGRLQDGSFLYPRHIPESDPLHDQFARPGQILIWPGQAVFGYPEQRSDDTRAPGPLARGGPDWMEHGSFFVLRRLRQDVDAFRAFAGDHAERIVGRHADGTPLFAADAEHPNNFAYRNGTPAIAGLDPTPGDPLGEACPFTAHIRKVNPRDATTDRGGPAVTLKLQILRRGIPFGPPWPADGERGLHFMAYTTRIREPFETLGAGWMNRSDAPEAGAGGPDLLVGQFADNRWVTPTGGGFFFCPSIPLLADLAAR